MTTMHFRCGHSSSLAQCQTSGCRGRATVLCDYPVRRKDGRGGRCNRHVCVGCAKRHEGRHLCPPHARVGVEALITICAACFTASCPAGEHRCASASKTRLVTAAEWKRLLCFGVP